ncbi:MAG: carboxypeptidase-like regulatory domain-containing protein, partial [Bacteroidales bacterium]|nr:carboxypeptidase-like regulatory domain-containing protein [Bacteroidales bacterium]
MKVSLILLLFLPVLTSAQQKYTLSGSVTDASSGEDLTGATVIAVGSNKGTATNSYGFYSISLPEGDITIRVSFIGYNTF